MKKYAVLTEEQVSIMKKVYPSCLCAFKGMIRNPNLPELV